MRTAATLRSPRQTDENAACRPLPRPGVVSGTVLRAARLSAVGPAGLLLQSGQRR